MNFPNTDDFLEAFGIEPIEEDPSMAYCRYVKASTDGGLEIDISFSAVTESFQVVLRCNGHEVSTISSEKVKSIELRQNGTDAGVHVVFNIQGVTSEALVSLEPKLNCRWWTLRSA